MTEQELRLSFALTAAKWIGVREGTEEHRRILAIYNSILPLPRGYRIRESDPWCAVFVSAVAWEAGFDKIMPLECSCPKMISLAKNMGIWMEDDAYMPKVGDWVLYNWDAGASGDDTGSPDHVGIVTHVQNGGFTVTEGNYDNMVKCRELRCNDRTIRGFICPDFASMATDAFGKRFRSIEDVPLYARDTLCKLIRDGSLQGIDRDNLGLTEEMVRILVILDRRGAL